MLSTPANNSSCFSFRNILYSWNQNSIQWKSLSSFYHYSFSVVVRVVLSVDLLFFPSSLQRDTLFHHSFPNALSNRRNIYIKISEIMEYWEVMLKLFSNIKTFRTFQLLRVIWLTTFLYKNFRFLLRLRYQS